MSRFRKIVVAIYILVSCTPGAAAQGWRVPPADLKEPFLLGRWGGGEDPSEFLIHGVFEPSYDYLESNPDGKLIAKICSKEEFGVAYLQALLAPIGNVAAFYSYRGLKPHRNIFLTVESECASGLFAHVEYWLIPGSYPPGTGKYYSADDFETKWFSLNKLDTTKADNAYIRLKFELLLADFVQALRREPSSKGYIRHMSKHPQIRRNVKSVYRFLKRNGIDEGRVRLVERRFPVFALDPPRVKRFYDDNEFPGLVTIKIRDRKRNE